eukprot:8270534-Pyramimonas_sp.AAC.1
MSGLVCAPPANAAIGTSNVRRPHLRRRSTTQALKRCQPGAQALASRPPRGPQVRLRPVRLVVRQLLMLKLRPL